jgi:hypothetical protein
MRQDAARQPRTAEAMAGKAEAIDHSSIERISEERREPRGCADGAPPAIGKLPLAKRWKVAPEARPQGIVVARRVVARSIHPVAPVVGRLAGSPEDSIVWGEPVVIEECPPVGDPLSPLPSDSCVLLEDPHFRVLENPHSQALRLCPQTLDQLDRIEDAAP